MFYDIGMKNIILCNTIQYYIYKNFLNKLQFVNPV